MRYLYHTLPHILISTFFVLFFNIPFAEASVIVRPPNNLGLVGYWSFDEGRGTQASDLSGGGNDGVLINSPVWVSGKAAGALDFNSDSASVDLSKSLGISNSDFTFSHWIKTIDTAGQVYTIGNAGSGNGYRFGIRVGRIGFLIGNGTNFTEAICGVETVNDNMWHLITGVFDRTNLEFRCYVDGELSGTVALLSSYPDMSDAAGEIGDPPCCQEFSGSIDEVRIYSRALSASEIQSLYANTKSTVVGEAPSNYYSDGLVAHYTFDGSTLSGATVSDVVGTSDGTVYGVLPTLGRIGQGVVFDGSNDWVDLGNGKTNNLAIGGAMSISFWLWANDDTTAEYLFDNRDPGSWWFLKNYNSGVCTNGQNLCFEGRVTATSAQWNPREWTHVAVTDDTSTAVMYINGTVVDTGAGEVSTISTNLRIGTRYTNSAYLGGIIDDVRIYNRALAAAEVRGLANGGFGTLQESPSDLLLDLVGWWKFSEGSGSTTVDEISGHNAPITGAEWSEGIGGGSALYFDGTNTDNVNIADISPMSTFTLTARIFNETGGDSRHSILRNFWEVVSGSQICFWSYEFASTYWRCSPGGSVPTNTWVHLATTWDGSVIRHYVNGQHVWTDSNISTGTSQSFTDIAGYAGRNFKGKIDELRIYDRTLSESEIYRLYTIGL